MSLSKSVCSATLPVLIQILCLLTPAAAQTSWIAPSGDWANDANWSAGVPNGNDAVITLRRTAQLTSGMGLCSTLEIGQISSTGTLEQTGGLLSASTLFVDGPSATPAEFHISNLAQASATTQTVGRAGWGTVRQTGGSNTASSRLTLGQNAGSFGRYELSGTAILQAGSMYIGGTPDAPATNGAEGLLDVSGGNCLINDTLAVGNAAGNIGTVRLSGGYTEADYVELGSFGGPGTLDITDSTADLSVVRKLTFGPQATYTAVEDATIQFTSLSEIAIETIDPTALAGLANTEFIFYCQCEPDTSSLEVASRDLGPTAAGLVDNFALNKLSIIGGNQYLSLADAFDNNPDAVPADVLYVRELFLLGAELDLAGKTVYYETLTNVGGTIHLNGGALIPIPEPASLAMFVCGAVTLLRRRRPARVPTV